MLVQCRRRKVESVDVDTLKEGRGKHLYGTDFFDNVTSGQFRCSFEAILVRWRSTVC